MPVPMIAIPIPDMIVFTSAKSRLIRPGTRIRSEIPWIACRSTSSAGVKASVRDVVRAIVASSRSFGIVMTVSTQSRSSSSPRSACICRFLPSNLNGLVTTAMVSAPSSLARLAMTGAAPGAGAAAEAGRDEHHVGAVERFDQLVGVFERRLAADVRVGAGAEPLGQLAADLDLVRRGVEFQRLQVRVGDDELDAVEAGLHHAVDGVAAAAADADDLDAGAGAAFLVELQPQRGRVLILPFGPPSEELLEQPAQPAGHAPERAGSDRPRDFPGMVPVGVHHQPDGRGERRIVDVVGETADARRHAAPDRQVEDLLGDLRHALRASRRRRSGRCRS